MNRLPRATRVRILNCLVEGCSLRATARMCDVSLNTVMGLLAAAGPVASGVQDMLFRKLACKQLQFDEVWSFVGAKDATVARDAALGKETRGGSVWTWTAIDPVSKLVPSFMVGERDGAMALAFARDVAGRMANKKGVQVTTDGLSHYVHAIGTAFGFDIDYAMLIKEYGSSADPTRAERRYSPSHCTGSTVEVVTGNPDPGHIRTEHVERANLTIRMGNRRFTRLTNAFSKKLGNHVASLSLFFFHYNLCRIHKTLRVTPAMEAKVTGRVWSLDDLVERLEKQEDEETASRAAMGVRPGRKPRAVTEEPS